MSDNVETVRSEVLRLEGLIKNCRHGGPSQSDQGTPWFQGCLSLATFDPTPTDLLLMSGHLSQDDDDDIRAALVATINVITNSRQGFRFALVNIGSKTLFASMAVDAWFNEDFLHVRKFLTKSIILQHLQNHGAQRTLQELEQPNDGGRAQSRHSLLQLVKGVLLCPEQGLKSYLEFCTDGSCVCIGLAQTLNDEKEILLNPHADRGTIAARRKEREDNRLPPVLKSSSKYWALKKKAAECLKNKKLEYSFKLYLKAKTMLGQYKDLEGAPLHQLEGINKIGDEIGKIASNLSMVCLMRDQREKALEYANEAVVHCPGWSKSYCRLALALKSLGRYEEAQLTIFNAIQKCKGEISSGGVVTRQQKEYQDIQKEIEAVLATSNANQQQSLPVENPLYKPWNYNHVGNGIGTMSCIGTNQDIMDIVYSFLAPTDVAHLERTCRRFAICAERGRRIAITSKLLSKIQTSRQSSSCLRVNDDKDAVTMENALAKYTNSVTESSSNALREFITDVRHMIRVSVWNEYILDVKLDPSSLNTILVTAFSTSSASDAQQLFEIIMDADFQLNSSRDIQIAKFLLQVENNSVLKHEIIHQMYSLDQHSNDFLRRFFQHSVDMEVMRLAVPVIDDDDTDVFGSNLRDAAFLLLNNTILSNGGRIRESMNQDHPIFRLGMAFNSLYYELIPDEWPGLIDNSFQWKSDPIEKRTIAQYWTDKTPTMFQMWRTALLKSLKWVCDVEKEGCTTDYLLNDRRILGEMVGGRHSPINKFSLGTFLVMKALECGGAVLLSSKLTTEEDLTDFFYDYYDFLHIFSAGFPALVKYTQSLLTRDNVRALF